jgi:hypothetical protein
VRRLSGITTFAAPPHALKPSAVAIRQAVVGTWNFVNRIGFFLFIGSDRLSLARHTVQSVAGRNLSTDASPVNVAALTHAHKRENGAQERDHNDESGPSADSLGNIEECHDLPREDAGG